MPGNKHIATNGLSQKSAISAEMKKKVKKNIDDFINIQLNFL